MDQFLRTHDEAREIVREVHPEVLFWALGNGRRLDSKKRSKAGFDEPLELLKRLKPVAASIMSHALSCWKRSEVKRDDIFDALAAAITCTGSC